MNEEEKRRVKGLFGLEILRFGLAYVKYTEGREKLLGRVNEKQKKKY